MNVIPRSGIAIVGLSTLWQAAGTVILAQVLDTSTALISTFAAFLASAALSLAWALMRIGPSGLWSEIGSCRRALFLVALNLATAGVLLSFYLALTLLHPVSLSVLDAGLAPVLVAIGCAVRSRRRPRPGRIAPPVVVALIACTVAIIPLDLTEPSVFVGLGLAVVTAASGAAVVLLSVELRTLRVSATSVNACRFHLAWIASALLWAAGPPVTMAVPHITGIIVASVALGGLPLVALQFGLMRASPLPAELVMSALPALVLVGEYLRGDRPAPLIAVLMAALLAIGATALVRENRNESRRKSAHLPLPKRSL